MPAPASVWKKTLSFLNRLEELLLGILLASMVLLGLLQILFRNILSVSLFWIDPLMRHMVLWIALLGASVATRLDRHISIDLFSHRLHSRARTWIQVLVHLFSAAVCLILVPPAVRFIQEEYPMGKILALGIPTWVSESVIPVMLLVLGLRFLGKAREDLFGTVMSRQGRDTTQFENKGR
jgi:TRAP-type C4-dicarboxylate transport system permease small subunit